MRANNPAEGVFEDSKIVMISDNARKREAIMHVERKDAAEGEASRAGCRRATSSVRTI